MVCWVWGFVFWEIGFGVKVQGLGGSGLGLTMAPKMSEANTIGDSRFTSLVFAFGRQRRTWPCKQMWPIC